MTGHKEREIAHVKAWMDYIDACIDEKIQRAFGRDSLSEGIRVSDCKRKIEAILDIAEWTL